MTEVSHGGPSRRYGRRRSRACSLGLDAPRGDEGIEVRDVVCDPAAELGVGRPHALDSPVLQGARRHGPQVGSSLALAKPARLDLYDVALGNHAAPQRNPRSEEHTSELQSLMRTSYAVFCLKTKKK